MKIKGIDLSVATTPGLTMYAEYTPGDVETLMGVMDGEDYTLMPTKEVEALVNVAEDHLYGNVDCNCDECDYLEYCNGCDGCEDSYPEPLFGGAYYDEQGNFVYIEKVIYDAPKTIVIWSDGTRTSSVCGERDIYNPEMGLALAVLKKLVSSEFVVRTLHDWAPNDSKEGDTTIKAIKTLRDVRREHKTQPKKDT